MPFISVFDQSEATRSGWVFFITSFSKPDFNQRHVFPFFPVIGTAVITGETPVESAIAPVDIYYPVDQ